MKVKFYLLFFSIWIFKLIPKILENSLHFKLTKCKKIVTYGSRLFLRKPCKNKILKNWKIGNRIFLAYKMAFYDMAQDWHIYCHGLQLAMVSQ
jgi:hypothetical protein